MRQPIKRRRGGAMQPGSAMVLVVLAMVVASVVGLTFLAASTTTTGIAQTLEDHTQARQIAESGLQLAVRYIESTPTWRSTVDADDWIDGLSILGGSVSVSGVIEFAATPALVTIDNAGFESQSGQLPSPLLFPPMSGTIGGWDVEREALLGPVTGLTVPQIGVATLGFTTEGTASAFITFPASVIGRARFSRILASTLEPNANYELKIDIGTAGIAALLAEFEVRVYAGSELIASTTDASLVTILDLSGDFKEYTLQFATGDTPDPGTLRIELHGQSLLGLLSAVAFDNVRLEYQPIAPVVLTAVGRYGRASHVVSATVRPHGNLQPADIVAWVEP